MKREKAYQFMVGKVVKHIINQSEDSQILMFENEENMLNLYCQDEEIGYQLLNKDFGHIE